ncbi:MAG: DUF2510 domain-containing protein [Ilumatobacteraceae bacterium]
MAAISNNERKSSSHRATTGAGFGAGALHLARTNDAIGAFNGGAASGWYPDPDDPGGLRFWDGQIWSEHRARLSMPAAPSSGAAVCSCGVAAIGRCRVCSDAYCRAHIAAIPVDDRPFRKRWEAWTCGNCIEDGQREIRALQLARCENVSLQMQRLPKLRNVRTPNGKRPPRVSLFQHPRKPTERPPRYATAYLIEYDGGPPDPRFEGLALSQDGSTVYNVGLPVTGVPKDRFGPKRNVSGYIVKNVIDVELLDEASARSTKDPWFEYAARSFLRVAHHIGIKPDFSIVFEVPALAPPPDDRRDDNDQFEGGPERDDARLDDDDRIAAEFDDDADQPSEDAGSDTPVDVDSPRETAHVASADDSAADSDDDSDDDSDADSDADTGDPPMPNVLDEIQSVEVEHDPSATVQLQSAMVSRQPDPPLSPPLPLPHP